MENPQDGLRDEDLPAAAHVLLTISTTDRDANKRLTPAQAPSGQANVLRTDVSDIRRGDTEKTPEWFSYLESMSS